MDFNNPNYSLSEKNIFDIRKIDHGKMLDICRQILVPAEELGFEVAKFEIKDSRKSNGELYQTIKENLTIILKKGNNEIDLSILIPKLIDDQYIIINGRRKIPFFQLFDIPLITRGKNIKLRTNVATLMVFESKEVPFIRLSFLGKKVPLSLLMYAYYGPDYIIDKFDVKNINEDSLNLEKMYDKLLYDLRIYYDESSGFTQDDFILELGQQYSKYNKKSKGEDVVYALDLIMKTDIMSVKFFHTSSVIEELIYVIRGNYVDDLDLTNKRLRCWEYIVTSKLAKIVFDLCISNRTSRQPKFNINSTQILNACNVSDIIQFDFAINPIDELTKLSRTSLVGPGGFDRENVPEHLRDIYRSMEGRLCPVDTPDRDNCGILQNLIPNVKLSDDFRFQDACQKQPISIPVSMVPLLSHDDQTRLQMAVSQMRQSIMLRNFDQPLIQSGCEGLYTNKTQFVKVAKKNGEVTYLDNTIMIVVYDDKTVDIFNIEYRKIYTGNLDMMKIYVKVGDKVKQGQILAESLFCNNGRIQFGKELLTAVMVYYGYNYEDGIVISDRLVKDDLLTSMHYEDLSFNIPSNKVLLTLDDTKYKPVPNLFDIVKAGFPYAKLKEIPTGNFDFDSVFNDPTELSFKKEIIITDMNIYANKWNTEVQEYNSWVTSTIEKQIEKENNIKKAILSVLSKEDAKKVIKDRGFDKFSNTGKFKIKGELIEGIRVEMFGIFFRKIQTGDKIGNRHGNKGVIASIVPHEKMPKLENGEHVDICINPLGIISRMNIGQLYELHLGMSVLDLKKELMKMIKEKNNQNKIKKYLLDYIDIIDKTENKWYKTQLENQLLTREIDEKFIQDLYILQPPFESVDLSDVKKALQYTNTKFRQKIYDPVSGQELQNKIAVGSMYFFKMVHLAESRLSGRSISGYARRTMQPLGGRKNEGGQRLGEMETSCLIAHDAPKNLHEFLTTKSDCIDLKNEYIKKTIEANFIREEDETSIIPESVKLLNAYLTVAGIDTNIGKEPKKNDSE